MTAHAETLLYGGPGAELQSLPPRFTITVKDDIPPEGREEIRRAWDSCGYGLSLLLEPGEPVQALRPIETLTEPNRTVLLLLDGEIVVEGWMSRHFERALGRVTFWTWDPRFCTVSQPIHALQIHALADRRSGELGAVPVVAPVVMAGCVEPVAWAEVQS